MGIVDAERDEVLRVLSSLVTDVFERPVSELTVNTRFNEDLDMDSLDVLALVAELERELAIEVEVSEIAEVATVGQTMDLAVGALRRAEGQTAAGRRDGVDDAGGTLDLG